MKKIKNSLSEWLVKNMIGDQRFVQEAESKIKKLVVIYPGRFQPMGKHHAETYEWAKKKFPNADVYIATSNKVELPKSPFSFNEKKKIINGYGIKNVVQVKNPYVATEILDKYDPNTTAVVFVVGSKDMDEDPRFKIGYKKSGDPTYYQEYNKNKDNMVGYDKHGYLIVAPHISLNVPGYGEMSGTQIRKAFSDPNTDEETKHKIFKGIFGYDKKPIYDLVVNKLQSLGEVMEAFAKYADYPTLLNNFAKLPIKEVSTSVGQGRHIVDIGPDIFDGTNRRYEDRVTNGADRLGWSVVDYILDTVNLSMNKDNILFPNGPQPRVSYQPIGVKAKHGDNIAEDNTTQHLNTNPGYLKWQNYITNVATASGMLLVKFAHGVNENKIKSKLSFGAKKLIETFIGAQKEVISEGGAAGHMMHPFDDNDMTFGDLKDLIRQSLQGELDVEEVSEKLDGQNIFITWQDGKLRGARNMGQVKNPITIADMSEMFAGRGDIQDAFVYAMLDLDSAISKLSEKDRDKLFENGKNFMNLEVLYPATKNVIDYDRSSLVFHGIKKFENGVEVGVVEGGASKLAGLIKKINQDTQEHFNIQAPVIVKMHKDLDFSEKQNYFLAKLNTLQQQFKLKDTDTLGMYHQAWWEDFISKKASSMKYAIPNNVLMGLVKRWAFFDKGFDIHSMKKEITNPEFLDWATTFDKQDHKKQVKTNITPFENIFLGLGAEVMKNVEGFLAVNPDKTVQSIRNNVAQTIKQIRSSGDLSSMEKMETQLKRIQAIGGFKQIVPSEGLVFRFKGRTLKFTGAFAAINNLLGITKFAR